MVMLWLVLHETRGRKGSGDRAPQSEGCPTGVDDRARAQRGMHFCCQIGRQAHAHGLVDLLVASRLVCFGCAY